MMQQGEIRFKMEFEKYLAEDAVSSSRLRAFRQAPLFAAPGHYGVADERKELSRDLVIGSATHALLWEPGEFEKRYKKLPELNLRKDEGRSELAWYYKTYGEAFCLSEREYNLAMALRAALWLNEDARFYLQAIDHSEVSVFWSDPETGIRKKARPDAFIEAGVCFDLKTTTDADEKGFKRIIGERGYDLQAALYVEGLRACGYEITHFAFIAIEKVPPFAIGIWQLSDDRLARAAAEVRDLCRRFKACQESGIWPGYGHGTIN
jgi:exodeoxyribonuclease VIII